jgi:transglutaminase-like putative cysteine protease
MVGTVGMVTRILPLAMVLLVAFGGVEQTRGQFDSTTGTPAAGKLGDSTKQTWEFGVVITAKGGPCVGLMGTIPLPTDWPEQQVKVVSEDISPTVRRHSQRKLDGLTQLLFEIPQLRAGETANCLLTVEVTRSVQLPPGDTSGLSIPDDLPREMRKYLGASPSIEVSNSKFRPLVRELTEGKETAWQQVEAIYDGVRERVKYEPENKDKFVGAAGALRDGQADKEDLNSLFVALCRVHKVPARMVWSMDSCYAEFYLADGEKDGAWYPCQVHDTKKQFGQIDDPRPILEKGDSFRVPEKRDPQRFVSEFLTGKGGGGKPSVEFRRRLVE